MSIKKLPSNAEFILRELVKADNPSEYLKTLYDNSSKKEQDELSGIIAELKREGYIGVQWADNLPYFVTLNNSARAYDEIHSDAIREEKLRINSVLHTAFDEYRITKFISEGGNGRVFEAETSSGEKCAIKTIDKQKINSNKLKRFKNELTFCLNSDHDNVLKVLDFGSSPGGRYLFYVMPLYPITLRGRMEKGLTPGDAIEIFINMMNGLEYAHGRGIVHRDIKPENILFSSDSNECIIADFGIAHFPENEVVTFIETKVSDRMANFNYAAPEQKDRNQSVDGRADLFAAGLILNEMLTRQLIGGTDYKTIGSIYPEYAFLDDIVEALYKQNPKDRMFPASRVRQELRARIEIQNKEAELEKANAAILKQENKAVSVIDIPRITNIQVKGNRLLFYMDNVIPDGWLEIMRYGSFSHSALCGYEKHCFSRQDEKTIFVPIFDHTSQEAIKTIIEYYKEWIPTVTAIYNNNQKLDYEKKIRMEKEQIRQELEKRRKEKESNLFIQNLLQ